MLDTAEEGMTHSNFLLAVEEILDGRLRSFPSDLTFSQGERKDLGRLIGLSKAGFELTVMREWTEEWRKADGV